MTDQSRGSDKATGQVRLALPSKGTLEEPVLKLLADCGLTVRRVSSRHYSATIAALPAVTVHFQRVPDIVSMVEAGAADLGITGYDLVAEARDESVDLLVLHPELRIAECDLALAVPDDWLDVATVRDLADLAATMHAAGRVLRVATKFSNLTRDFLYDKGITHFTLVPGHGALEAAPTTGAADIITDLVTTGTTLRENRLKQIGGGTILHCQACIIGNIRRLRADPAVLAAARTLLELIEAQMRAAGYFAVTANVSAESAEAIGRHLLRRPELAGLQGPTVSKVVSKTPGKHGWYAARVVVRQESLLPLVDYLRRAGGTDVTVSRLDYVFGDRSRYYQALTEQLKRR